MRVVILALLIVFVSCSSTEISAEKEELKILEEIKSFPKYNSVAQTFLERYQKLETAPLDFKFAKKPEGWVVVVTSYENNEIGKPVEHLFWSKEKKEYLELKIDGFAVRRGNPAGEIENFLYRNYNSAFYASRMPYHNYFGFEEDVIRLLEPIENPDDTLCHALGVAYFSKTFKILGYIKPEGTDYIEKFNSDDLKEYLEVADKCRDIYLKGIKKNPGFEGFVGNLKTKMGHDLIGIWYEMFLRGLGDKAFYLLKDIDYPENVIDFAKSTLAQCEPNAILFTNGDTDTYSLLYVQHYLNYRKDVAIINTSLLQTEFYPVKWKGIYDLPMSIPDRSIESDYTELFFCGSNEIEESDAVEFLNKFSESAIGAKIDQKITDQKDFIVSPKTLVWNRKDAGNEELSSISFTWSLSYAYRASLLMMDIILTNDFKRPVYFTSSTNYNEYKHLLPYLSYQGMVIQILPKKMDAGKFSIHIDKEKLLQTLNADDFNKKYAKDELEFNIINTLINLIFPVIYNNEEFEEETVLAMMEKYFDFIFEKGKLDLYSINVALYYEKLVKPELVGPCLKKILDKAESEGIEKDRNLERKVEGYKSELIRYGFKEEADRLMGIYLKQKKVLDNP